MPKGKGTYGKKRGRPPEKDREPKVGGGILTKLVKEVGKNINKSKGRKPTDPKKEKSLLKKETETPSQKCHHPTWSDLVFSVEYPFAFGMGVYFIGQVTSRLDAGKFVAEALRFQSLRVCFR